MASNAEKLDPELWEQAKADAREKFGGHSARAMQYAVKLYKARGGRYKGRKKADNRLTQWTEQDWTTKSGRPSRETGERYLPRAAIESLTPAEYGATTRAKRRGGGVGSVVAQPPSIREKTRKFRKVNPIMATPAQIAARKKFAERARSGELAKMRKKATKRNPMPTKARAVKSNPKNRDSLTDEYRRMDFETFKDYYFENQDNNMHSENVVILARRYGTAKMVKEAENIAKIHDRVGYLADDLAAARRKLEIALLPKYGFEMSELIRKTVKRNPTATRAPARKRTQLVSNGERKKNPATKDVFFVNVIDDGGFQFGMDDRTPVLFKFSNREMKKGVYRSFALPFNVTNNAEFQNFVKSLPGNQIVISLKDLRKQLSAYA